MPASGTTEEGEEVVVVVVVVAAAAAPPAPGDDDDDEEACCAAEGSAARNVLTVLAACSACDSVPTSLGLRRSADLLNPAVPDAATASICLLSSGFESTYDATRGTVARTAAAAESAARWSASLAAWASIGGGRGGFGIGAAAAAAA